MANAGIDPATIRRTEITPSGKEVTWVEALAPSRCTTCMSGDPLFVPGYVNVGPGFEVVCPACAIAIKNVTPEPAKGTTNEPR